jgi:hypothetical protein
LEELKLLEEDLDHQELSEQQLVLQLLEPQPQPIQLELQQLLEDTQPFQELPLVKLSVEESNTVIFLPQEHIDYSEKYFTLFI